jgi:hypothetical protein
MKIEELKKTHEVYKSRIKTVKTKEEKKIIVKQAEELNILFKNKKKEIAENEHYKSEYVGFMKNIKSSKHLIGCLSIFV